VVVDLYQRDKLGYVSSQEVVRLFPDWGYEWPLWTSEMGGTTPDALALSAELRSSLRAWHDEWLESYLPGRGWSTVNQRDRWFERGQALLAQLRTELKEASVLPKYEMYDEVETPMR